MLEKIKTKYQALPVSARAAFWFLLCSILQKGISTITTPIFTRLLTTEEYGNYSVFNSWLGIVSIVATLSLTNGISLRGVIKFSEDKAAFTSSIHGLVLTSVAASTLIYALQHEYWNRLFSLSTVQMTALFVIVWTNAVFEIWSAYKRIHFRYRALVALTAVMGVARPAVGIFFVLHAEDKVTARILSIALVQLIGYTWLFVLQMKKGRRFFVAQYWKYAILYSLPLIPQGLAEVVLNSSDRIMISKMIGDSEAGIYSLAYSLSQLMLIIGASLMKTINPWIYQKLKEKRLNNIPPVAVFTLLLVAGANLLLISIAPEAVRLFAPPEYHKAIWIIPPLAMSVVAIFLRDWFCKLEFYYEKTYFVMLASSAAAIVNIVLNYVFIGKYGYFAAGYTTLLCFILDAAGHYLFMRRIAKMHLDGAKIFDLKAMMRITAAFFAASSILMALYSFSVVRYALVGFAAALTLCKYKSIAEKTKSLFRMNNR